MAATCGSVRLDDNTEIKGEFIKKAFSVSWEVHMKDEHYLLHEINRSEVIISFPASGDIKDWYSQRTFGETKINLDLFPSLKSIGKDEPALVNESFQQRFQHILDNSSLKVKVDNAMKDKKKIVFVGHSSGAPMAILATFWTLEKYLIPNSHGQMRVPPLCVTFGSPLVGNHIFSHVTRRENWSRYFLHIVMRYDIVPRIFFAPLSSLDERFQTISQFFNPKSKSFMSESVGSTIEAYDFYLSVMSNAATVTSNVANKLMRSIDSCTLETLENFIPLSPYRPFGTYIFCTENGNETKQIVVQNPDVVLQLMFCCAQPRNEVEIAQVSYRSFREHVIQDTELQPTLEMHNVVYFVLNQPGELSLSEDDEGDYTATINTDLNDHGLCATARLCFLAAAETEVHKSKNENEMEGNKGFIEERMKVLEKYKEKWEHKKGGYYNNFKARELEEDLEANVKRLELAYVWDEIIDRLRNYELPDEFEGKDEWIKLGTRFRQLVEPLDIANFYRFSMQTMSGGGPYKSKGRPKRYRYTQRWLEHAQRRPQEANPGSCFWADVEELCNMI